VTAPACSQGLKASLAAELLLRDGPNALRPPRGTPEYVKFARQLAGGLQCLMWVAAAICLIAFAIQASEGDLTTDDNVSWRALWAGLGHRELRERGH
jgi:H+/K+-exchanging ATPase alpha polypeptide